jgi:hypothetical protein
MPDARGQRRAATFIRYKPTRQQGDRTGALSHSVCCAYRATTDSAGVAHSRGVITSRLLRLRGGAHMPDARGQRRAASFIKYKRTRQQGGKTGAPSQAVCCARIATADSGRVARSRGLGASLFFFFLRLRGGAHTPVARGQRRAAGFITYQRAGLQGDRTGDLSQAVCSA